MPVRMTDAEITALLNETKVLPINFRERFVAKEKRSHIEQELTVSGESGNQFKVILRESKFNAMDFSVILAFEPQDSNILFRLRRYNGKCHEHTNKIEKQTFYDFHIHMATERYQQFGEEKEDAYA